MSNAVDAFDRHLAKQQCELHAHATAADPSSSSTLAQ